MQAKWELQIFHYWSTVLAQEPRNHSLQRSRYIYFYSNQCKWVLKITKPLCRHLKNNQSYFKCLRFTLNDDLQYHNLLLLLLFGNPDFIKLVIYYIVLISSYLTYLLYLVISGISTPFTFSCFTDKHLPSLLGHFPARSWYIKI